MPGARALLLLAVAAIALAAPASAGAERAALETILQDDAQLLHGDDEQVRAAFAQVRDFGVDRVRLTAGWSVLTRNADTKERPVFDATDPAAYEQARWAGLDRAVRLAAEHGLTIMIDAGFWAPLWATQDAEGPRARTYPDARAFADFALAVARRYDGTFVPPPPRPEEVVVEPSDDEEFLEDVFDPFPEEEGPEDPESSTTPPPVQPSPLPRVDVLSLWNEPNHQAFLQPLWHVREGSKALPASPTVYRAMVEAADPAVKATRPDLKVLIGATSSMGDHTGRGKAGVPPLRFIRDMACVNRKLRPLRAERCTDFRGVPGDGWTHHPYSMTSTPALPSPPAARDNARMGDLRRMTRLLDRLADSGRIAEGLRHVWLTEYGYESRVYPGRPEYKLEEQAVFLTWAEYLAWRNPRVKTYAQFLLRDLPYSGPEKPLRRPQGHWESGLLFADGRPKPMADAFRAGLHAERRGDIVELWARTRSVPEGATAVIERRLRGGRWQRLTSGTIGGRRVVVRRIGYRRGARYRMYVEAPDRILRSFTVRAR